MPTIQGKGLRLSLAVFAGAGVGLLFMTVTLGVVAGRLGTADFLERVWFVFTLNAIVLSPIAVGLTAAVGIPAYQYFERRDRLSVWVFTVLGLCIGSVIGLVMGRGSANGITDNMASMAILAAAGGGSGWAFGAVAVLLRPAEKSEP